MRLRIAIAALGLSVPLVTLAEAKCGPLPVASKEIAICLARQFVNAPTSPEWEVTFSAEEVELQWRVWFGPKSSDVRGGSGELVVDKQSGKVTVVHLYR